MGEEGQETGVRKWRGGVAFVHIFKFSCLVSCLFLVFYTLGLAEVMPA